MMKFARLWLLTAVMTAPLLCASARTAKVHIPSTGVYRVDYATLRQWGFDAPENVGAKGYGSVEIARSLGARGGEATALPVMHRDGALYFYAEGSTRDNVYSISNLSTYQNYYSDGSCLFLTDEGEAVAPESLGYTEGLEGEAATTHLSFEVKRFEEVNPARGGAFFHSRKMTGAGDSRKVAFSAHDCTGEAFFRAVTGYLNTETTAQKGKFALSGDITTDWDGLVNYTYNYSENRIYSLRTTNQTVTLGGSGAFEVTVGPDEGASFDYFALDKLMLCYSRANRYGGGQLQMHLGSLNGVKCLSISELPASAVVLDVTQPTASKVLEVRRGADAATAYVTVQAEDAMVKIVAFDPAGDIPAPELVSDDVHFRGLPGMESVDMLIVTLPSLKGEAERLAAAHRSLQGLKVAVVTDGDVYNEYSSGNLHPNAIRLLVKDLAAREDTPLRYLLLMGRGTYDPRAIMRNEVGEDLPGHECDFVNYASFDSKNYMSDAFFAMPTVPTEASLASQAVEYKVAVGRVPAKSQAEAAVYVDKAIRYLEDPMAAGRFDRALFACCSGDTNAHLESSQRMAETMATYLPQATADRFYYTFYPSKWQKPLDQADKSPEDFLKRVRMNNMLVNYTGHADVNAISVFFDSWHTKRATFGTMPMFFIAGCEAAVCDFPGRYSLCEYTTFMPKGPIASIGSVRVAYLTSNQKVNELFVNDIYSPDGAATYGEAWMATLNATRNITTAQRINNLCYVYLGDPALPVRRPGMNVLPETLDGAVIATETAPMLTPGATHSVEGCIRDAEGNVDESFSGTLLVSLSDAPVDRKCYIHSGSNDTYETIETDEVQLIETSAAVTNGRWRAELAVPAEGFAAGTHKLALLAYEKGGQRIAAGGITGIQLSDAVSEAGAGTSDTDAPAIAISVDLENAFGSMLCVRIEDAGSGFNLGSCSGVGAQPSVMVDGKALLADASDLFTFTGHGELTLERPLPDLQPGHHTITVKARDAAGNHASASHTFLLERRPLGGTLVADTSIARDAVTITVAEPLGEDVTATLLVTDRDGRNVLVKEGAAFPFAWDLRDADGNTVPDGSYEARALLRDAWNHGGAAPVTFVVAKKR